MEIVTNPPAQEVHSRRRQYVLLGLGLLLIAVGLAMFRHWPAVTTSTDISLYVLLGVLGIMLAPVIALLARVPVVLAVAYIDAYFEKYQGVRRFIDQTLAQVKRDQKVTTLFGRVRPIPDILSKNSNLRGFAERTAVNTPLQGTAADLIKIAMIRIDRLLRERNLKSRMLLQVHDELVFEAPEEEIESLRALVKEQMEQAHPLKVPLLVDIGVGKNWRDLD